MITEDKAVELINEWLNLSKEKGVSLISIFNVSGMSDARLPDIHFIEGKKIEQSMTWAEFKTIAREFYK